MSPVQGPANSIDAYAPPQMARLVSSVGVRKANLPALQLCMLGVLAGVFIAFGAMLFTLVMTDSALGFGLSRWIGGLAFSLGLILVIVGGAELFTGNNLIVMAWAESNITTRQLLRNWTLVYAANLAGSLFSVFLVWNSGILNLGGGRVGRTAAAIASAKLELDFVEAFFRGILCNTLVCLAIWLCFSAHRVSGKILCILFPISAFVALGFEHSIANMYLIPIGMLAGGGTPDVIGFVENLVPVTLGNVVGGSAFVALTYWVIYLRGGGEAMR